MWLPIRWMTATSTSISRHPRASDTYRQATISVPSRKIRWKLLPTRYSGSATPQPSVENSSMAAISRCRQCISTTSVPGFTPSLKRQNSTPSRCRRPMPTSQLMPRTTTSTCRKIRKSLPTSASIRRNPTASPTS